MPSPWRGRHSEGELGLGRPGRHDETGTTGITSQRIPEPEEGASDLAGGFIFRSGLTAGGRENSAEGKANLLTTVTHSRTAGLNGLLALGVAGRDPVCCVSNTYSSRRAVVDSERRQGSCSL